jgi:hypothetical protein
MLYRLTIVVVEAVLCFFKIIDATKRQIRNDYPALHGKR